MFGCLFPFIWFEEPRTESRRRRKKNIFGMNLLNWTLIPTVTKRVWAKFKYGYWEKKTHKKGSYAPECVWLQLQVKQQPKKEITFGLLYQLACTPPFLTMTYLRMNACAGVLCPFQCCIHFPPQILYWWWWKSIGPLPKNLNGVKVCKNMSHAAWTTLSQYES